MSLKAFQDACKTLHNEHVAKGSPLLKKALAVVPKEALVELGRKLEDRYLHRLTMAMRGVRGYRFSECQELVKLWQGIQEKDFDYDKMSNEERNELQDGLDEYELVPRS